MNSIDNDSQKLLQTLQERAKELQCLYKVKEIVNKEKLNTDEVFEQLVEVIPLGWQYPELCLVRIKINDKFFVSPHFVESEVYQEAPINLNGERIGKIEVFYTLSGTGRMESPFLEDEQKLLNSIADRIENYLFQIHLQSSVEQWEQARKDLDTNKKPEWMIILELIEKMDSNLFFRICRRMLNHLCWLGITEAQNILGCLGSKKECKNIQLPEDANRPSQKINLSSGSSMNLLIFRIAAQNFSNDDILTNIQKWIKEDKIGFLVRVLENTDTSLAEISVAVSRYHHLDNSQIEISSYSRSNINALFMQRLFTEQMEFIILAREYININDFYSILQHTIHPNNSHGKLGGKSTGLFIAGQLLKGSGIDIKTPKTWYISSDYMLTFIYYNNLEEALEQKYKEIEEIRTEYPNLVQVFKNSNFPMDFVNGLTRALDDFGNSPIIVRSSSLLEDRFGTVFAGKYKSLFLSNQGTREEKLTALLDAIAEVYASVFGPDPIEYRKVHSLLEYHEEMAIILQEVVGTTAGNYYFPSFAGVAFSKNDFRWSPRIKTDDGLLRIVPGLGTRAVDRLSNDYPVLISPGNPDIKVNPDPDEAARYSPRQMDVINLKENRFETVDVIGMIRECGRNFPDIEKLVSIYEENHLVNRNSFQIDYDSDDLIVTLDPLLKEGVFTEKIMSILKVLKEKMKVPVDIEFAYCNGQIYLLQCRPQASSAENLPIPIPQDIPKNDILFNAHKYISNGQLSNITHIVYVDPDNYSTLEDLDALERVGSAVSRINSLLPKRQFILMGPGRWGSRGDIQLGVKVNYSDINNTAMLIEVARMKGDYLPELSFGTHFFQDLVESSIKYLPLYPDNPENIFNQAFLTRSHNILEKILPEFRDLSDTVFVIDIPAETGGRVLKVLMNSEIKEAVAFFSSSSNLVDLNNNSADLYEQTIQEDCWRWRFSMAEKIAQSIDAEKFGVKAFYVFGSTKNATAGPMSDIDLLIHMEETGKGKEELALWLDGWSLCLGQINYLRTGYDTRKLLDVHYITDRDIQEKNSYAVKIGAVTDAARELPLDKK